MWKILRIAEQRGPGWENSKIRGKPGHGMSRQKSSGTGINLKQNQQTVNPPFEFVCEPFHPINELIHLTSVNLVLIVPNRI